MQLRPSAFFGRLRNFCRVFWNGYSIVNPARQKRKKKRSWCRDGSWHLTNRWNSYKQTNKEHTMFFGLEKKQTKIKQAVESQCVLCCVVLCWYACYAGVRFLNKKKTFLSLHLQQAGRHRHRHRHRHRQTQAAT